MHPKIFWCLEKGRKSLRRCSEHLWGVLFFLSVSELVCTPWGQISVRDDTNFPGFPIKSHNTNTFATTARSPCCASRFFHVCAPGETDPEVAEQQEQPFLQNGKSRKILLSLLIAILRNRPLTEGVQTTGASKGISQSQRPQSERTHQRGNVSLALYR